MSTIGPPKSSYFVKATNSKTPLAPTSSEATNPLNIPGCRTSLQNNQLLTPIGIPSIDSFIGGGLPVGSVCLIVQDTFNNYADIIGRCFIAEGIVQKHSLYIADLTEDLNHLLQRIPNVNKHENESSPVSNDSSNDQLRIAWRYGQQPQSAEDISKMKASSAASSFQANYFVMNKYMNSSEMESSTIRKFQLNDATLSQISTKDTDQLNSVLYVDLAKDISATIDELHFNINKTKQYKNILRIVINSLGGLVWNDKSSLNDHAFVPLCRFLLYLRQTLRHSLAVCVITLPKDVASDSHLMNKLIHLTDYSFIMDDSSQSFRRLTNTQYEGLFRLEKLPRLNSLSACFMPETLDLAFYMKRKRLIVEQLHLPPDLTENDHTAKGRTNTAMSCSSSSSAGASSNNKLDF